MANSTGCQVVVDLAVHSPELLGPVVLVGPTVDRGARSIRQQCVRLFADQRWESHSLAVALLLLGATPLLAAQRRAPRDRGGTSLLLEVKAEASQLKTSVERTAKWLR